MTKVLMWIGGAVVVGAGAYVLMSGQKDESQPDEIKQESSEEVVVEQNMSGTGSLLTMMEVGKDIECDFTSEDEFGSTVGIFKYTDGQYRVSAETRSDEGIYQSDVYSDGEQNYVWSSGPQGEMAIVMASDKSEADEMANEFAVNQQGQGFDMDSNTSYECRNWNANKAELQPPENIEFVDMEEMMQEMMEGFDFPEGMPQSM